MGARNGWISFEIKFLSDFIISLIQSINHKKNYSSGFMKLQFFSSKFYPTHFAVQDLISQFQARLLDSVNELLFVKLFL